VHQQLKYMQQWRRSGKKEREGRGGGGSKQDET